MIKRMILFLIFCLIVFLWVTQIIPMGIAILRTSAGFLFAFPNYENYWFESIELDENASTWLVTYKNDNKERLILDAEPEWIPVLAGQRYYEEKLKYQKTDNSSKGIINEILNSKFDSRSPYSNRTKSDDNTTNTEKPKQSSDRVYNLSRD